MSWVTCLGLVLRAAMLYVTAFQNGEEEPLWLHWDPHLG